MSKRRIDAVDVLLEEWATWRVLFHNFEVSTGHSPLVHFNDPRSTVSVGSIPLWYGAKTRPVLLALDHDLSITFDATIVAQLVVCFGTPGSLEKKAKAIEISAYRLQKLSKNARRIALEHISQTV